MNPNGELVLSVKMEDKYALENVDDITSVPGIAWGEWGPGDQAMSLVGLEYLKSESPWKVCLRGQSPGCARFWFALYTSDNRSSSPVLSPNRSSLTPNLSIRVSDRFASEYPSDTSGDGCL